MNFSGMINPDKAKILSALTKYEKSHTDIVDCILAAQSSPSRVVISFDNDMKRLNAVHEHL